MKRMQRKLATAFTTDARFVLSGHRHSSRALRDRVSQCAQRAVEDGRRDRQSTTVRAQLFDRPGGPIYLCTLTRDDDATRAHTHAPRHSNDARALTRDDDDDDACVGKSRKTLLRLIIL